MAANVQLDSRRLLSEFILGAICEIYPGTVPINIKDTLKSAHQGSASQTEIDLAISVMEQYLKRLDSKKYTSWRVAKSRLSTVEKAQIQ